ncbi:1-aminocyclopropane-1-carboxylate deaminase/D-cysteine desulfhydrase [Algoriphagus kandeliae]|uniref:1-aminocyclopropane-1-carboxylate deaminase/D-cysteine desulfhydrase n=1 Tax=Algoriphagus kandeliae TaxID=2562278 RepID=A0A4Y9QM87_9BACT|nr:pyridoxal-phosphate dependent enzyme [Algoriphagus kandeliae]TFV92013.1 1-aminocyclopropane-1-carboxylate deaminase/D-cysteine desulfhydrase [Algoriphagus kandeliae]
MLEPNPIINQILDHPLLEEKGVELSIKRLDWVHELVPGNKFFKLKYNLEKAIRENKNTLLTFGGAYSNHIHAVANAAHSLGINAIGIIRGEETFPLNPTLSDAKSKGMHLHYISRSLYREKTDDSFIQELHDLFGDFYLIPEGGTNLEAIKGTQEILKEEDQEFSYISLSIGTGGTFAGILQASQNHQKILGFSSLKGDFIKKEMEALIKTFSINPKGQFQIFTDYHFGGYAKYDQSLVEFIWWFFETFGIVLDPIYTGKMLFGIWDLIKKDYFPKGSKILAIHTGGIQGNKGFTFQTGIKLPSL